MQHLPDPGAVSSVLTSVDQHPFATLAVIILAVLAVAWRYAGKKRD